MLLAQHGADIGTDLTWIIVWVLFAFAVTTFLVLSVAVVLRRWAAPGAWIVLAAILAATAVGVGAHHAHGLESNLVKRALDADAIAKQMHNCDVAVKYQMYHALAILGIGLLAMRKQSWLLCLATSAMLVGVAGFSGGLYAMVFDIAKLHWSIVPLGGLLMILGWIMLSAAGFCMACERPDASKGC